MEISFVSKQLVRLLLVVFAISAIGAGSQSWAASAIDNYNQVIKPATQIQPLGPDLFGEEVNLLDGTVQFRVVDVAAKSNSEIPISIGRIFAPGEQTRDQGAKFSHVGAFGPYWDIDIPRMQGVFDTFRGWVGIAQTGQVTVNRCTEGRSGPGPTVGIGAFSGVTYEPEDFFSGVTVSIPGKGTEQLLQFPDYKPKVISGNTYYYKTKPNWIFSCIPLAQGSGEGFLARLPDGTTYKFNWMTSRSAGDIWDATCVETDVFSTLYALEKPGESCYKNYAVIRSEVFIYATEVTDRFGNKVNYDFSGGRLTRIRSSDGVVIDIRYDSSSRVSEIQFGEKIWTYVYDSALRDVVLPDESKWSYQYPSNITEVTTPDPWRVWRGCKVNVDTKTTSVAPASGEAATYIITHPSGAVGTFKLRRLLHGTNEGEANCRMVAPVTAPWNAHPVVSVPSAYMALSLYEKTITGPGLATQKWVYRYAPSWVTPYTSITTVVDPDNVETAYKFGNDRSSNYGFLLSVATKKAGVEFRRVDNTYLGSASGQNFEDLAGRPMRGPVWSGPASINARNRPSIKRVISQDGATFTEQIPANCGGAGIYCFDEYVRPTKIVKTGSL